MIVSVITRDCEGVSCPRASDPASHTTCLGGQCVPPSCTELGGPDCGDAECVVDADCSVECGGGAATCAGGACLCPGALPAGDGGVDAGGMDACLPGTEICNGADDDCDGRIDEGCGPVCGDGACNGGESCADCADCVCPRDCPCPPVCGDGTCEADEACAADCPAGCPGHMGRGACGDPCAVSGARRCVQQDSCVSGANPGGWVIQRCEVGACGSGTAWQTCSCNLPSESYCSGCCGTGCGCI